MSTILFTSNKNYLKADQADTRTVTCNKPTTYYAPYLMYFNDVTVNHNLGYRPIVRAWYSPNGDNTRFCCVGDWSSGRSDLLVDATVPFDCFIYDINTTTITFRCYKTSSLAGTFPIYYKVYLDPTI